MTDRRRQTLPGVGHDHTATEAEAVWRTIDEAVERRTKQVWGALGEVRDDVSDLRLRVARLEGRPHSGPPPGVVELSGPKGLRLRGAAWAVVLLVALGALVAVAWWWAPPRVPAAPQTHGGKMT